MVQDAAEPTQRVRRPMISLQGLDQRVDLLVHLLCPLAHKDNITPFWKKVNANKNKGLADQAS
jgi:hypothetical protein